MIFDLMLPGFIEKKIAFHKMDCIIVPNSKDLRKLPIIPVTGFFILCKINRKYIIAYEISTQTSGCY